MIALVRWLCRLAALAILAGVWVVLPVLMPGPSRLLTLIHFGGLVAAVDFSLLALLVSAVPVRPKRMPASPTPEQIATGKRVQP